MNTAAEHQVAYNYNVVRQFTIATLIWGVIGMSMGAFIAAQLVWPQLNFDLPWTSFGRIRPIHTNLVIFAFGGCALISTSFYIVQRTCYARLPSDTAANLFFWGWQAMLIATVVSYALGYTTTKEYAEMEWPLAIVLTLLWLTYMWLFFGTIMRRKTSHIYVANWFYGAFIVVTAMVHIVNHIAIPVTLMKSYPVHAGALGWVAMISVGSLYHLIPKLWNHKQMYSIGLINVHFWLATIGTVIYIAAMWVNGLTQGLMWRAINDDGTLSYSFVEVLQSSHAGYIARLIGGSFFVLGMFIMLLNTWLTLRQPIEQQAATRLAEV